MREGGSKQNSEEENQGAAGRRSATDTPPDQVKEVSLAKLEQVVSGNIYLPGFSSLNNQGYYNDFTVFRTLLYTEYACNGVLWIEVAALKLQEFLRSRQFLCRKTSKLLKISINYR